MSVLAYSSSFAIVIQQSSVCSLSSMRELLI